MARNVFNTLLSMAKRNALSMDENGEWTVIYSSVNKKRAMEGGLHGLPGGQQWVPKKIYIDDNDLRDIWKEQGEKCYWFHIPLDFNLLYSDYHLYRPKHPLAPSIDKIDDNGDYTRDNVVICCRLANFGRNIHPFGEFHDVIETITGKPFPQELRKKFPESGKVELAKPKIMITDFLT